MKKVRLTTIMMFAFLSLTAMGCKEKQKGNVQNTTTHSEMEHNKMEKYKDIMDSDKQNLGAQKVLTDYMALKDALVNDDSAKAKELGKVLSQSLKSFNSSSFSSKEKSELNDIIEDANEHAEHISESDISHQREHFKVLSKDMTDMVAITGTSMTIYEQYCPMYDNNKGGAWLSMNEEIKNPYFGDKMLKCGKVQREIN